MIIDFHTHVEHKPDGSRYSPAEFVAAMDQGGIDKFVVVGKATTDYATIAHADKAKPGVEVMLDYMVKLIEDVMERFPPGVRGA